MRAVALEDASPWLELVPLPPFWRRCSSIPAASRRTRSASMSGGASRPACWPAPALTIVITQFAAALGTRWSGLFSTFPVMGSIICISSHLQYGRHAVQEVGGRHDHGPGLGGDLLLCALYPAGADGDVAGLRPVAGGVFHRARPDLAAVQKSPAPKKSRRSGDLFRRALAPPPGSRRSPHRHGQKRRTRRRAPAPARRASARHGRSAHSSALSAFSRSR